MNMIHKSSALTQTQPTSQVHGGRAATSAVLSSWVVLVALFAAPLLFRDFVVFQITTILIYAIAVMGLSILTGVSGQFSLGHSAFFAVGAYTAAILMDKTGLNYLLTLPVAGIVSFLFGFLFGFPALRLSGIYLALATFVLGVAVPQLLRLSVLEFLTGGQQGILLESPDTPFNIPVSADRWHYYLVLACGLAVYFLLRNLLASRSGRALMGIRDNPIAAVSMGINLPLYKTLVFGLSAGIAGIAGALNAIVVGYVAPDGFSIQLSNSLFLGMIIGGVGWLPGSLIGAAFIVLVPNFAENISKGLSGAVFGAIIIAVIFLLPGGAQQAAKRGTGFLQRVFRLRN